jgi:hypothetical protein
LLIVPATPLNDIPLWLAGDNDILAKVGPATNNALIEELSFRMYLGGEATD